MQIFDNVSILIFIYSDISFENIFEVVEPLPVLNKVPFSFFAPAPIYKFISLFIFFNKDLNFSGNGSIFISCQPLK